MGQNFFPITFWLTVGRGNDNFLKKLQELRTIFFWFSIKFFDCGATTVSKLSLHYLWKVNLKVTTLVRMRCLHTWLTFLCYIHI